MYSFLLFPQILGVQISLEGFFVEVADRKESLFVKRPALCDTCLSKNDAILVHLLYLVQIDDIGAMNAHEVVWQPFLHFLHR